MKIALITSMKYGLTQFTLRDIQALKAQGHEVRIFTLRHERGLYNPPADWDVITASFRSILLHHLRFLARHPRRYLALLRTALRTGSRIDLAVAISFVERMRDIDVIYAYFGDHKFFTGYYCKRMTGIPLAVTIRAYELYRNPNPVMMREALAYCDQIVTITEYNRRMLIDRFGAADDKIDIVRQIVDLDEHRDEPKITILIVGFFAEKKGHDVLFRAIREMNRPDVELWVVGDTTPTVVKVDCRQLAKDLGIEAQVAFFGAQRDAALRALYRECDIFCLPSRPDRFGDQEGFPNVIAEAMAFGKPVVTTRHAGIPEAVDTLLVDENSVEQLADALGQACDSAALRRQLGRRNREVAERLFSPANSVKLEAILKRVADPSRAEDTSRPTARPRNDAVESDPLRRRG